MKPVRRALALALAATFGAALAPAALAQSAANWPVKPIRMIVPFTGGSGTDIVARAVSERLSQNLGQPVIIENRPGAGGTIGAALVAKAEPDGYTILVQSSSHTVTPTTYKSLTYDTERDLAGVTPIAALPNVLIVSPSKGVKSVKELVAAAKAKPGTMNYASAGAGSATHLNAERFRLAAGFDGVHIPFKGTPEAVTEVITGRVDMYFCPVVSALPFLRDNKVVGLAVGSSKRSSVLPDLPTTVELGFANSDYNFWVGMLVPSKTPKDIVAKIHAETLKALGAPDVKERLAKLGAEPMTMSPAEFDRYIAEEIKSNAVLIRAAKIESN